MTPNDDVKMGGLVPYLHYDDVEKAMAWIEHAFGFKEARRWPDKDGVVANAEIAVGDTEVWLDREPGHRERRGTLPAPWVGVWVNDPDAMYRRLIAASVEAEPPVDKPWGVRIVQVADPDGYLWGFMKRIPVPGC